MRTSHFTLALLLLLFTRCSGQDQHSKVDPKAMDNVATETYGRPAIVNAQDTSRGWWRDSGPKLLLTGKVLQRDGQTPAANVIVYYYQTNSAGKYEYRSDEETSLPPNSLGQTHGYIRGWVKTGADGRYAIYTVKPGTYPSRDEPAHIHVTISEPDNAKSYYIDDFVFDDDPLLTTAKRRKLENRGGSGVMRLVKKDGLLIAERNIILVNSPESGVRSQSDRLGSDLGLQTADSGLSIGSDVISFTPFHAWGPDKGTRTCPICKYGWYHGILYFVGNDPDWTDIKRWLSFLETEGVKREKHLKVYFIYGNEKAYDRPAREAQLAAIGEELKLKKTALTFVPSFSDRASEIYLNKIDPKVKNTFLLYKRSNVFAKFVNLEANPKNFGRISKALDENINEYFGLPSGN